MIRVSNLTESLDFFINKLGLIETKRYENEKGRFTLVFLSAPADKERASQEKAPLIELTYNWPDESQKELTYSNGTNFGHLAFRVDDIYKTCEQLLAKGVKILRPPRDGHMAFIKSPDGISIELLQKGNALETKAPWSEMPNSGSW